MTPRDPQAPRPSPLRRIAVAAVLLLGAVALLVAGACGILLGTTTGARWALDYLGGVLPGALTTRTVRGTLASPLELRGIEYRTDSLLVTIAHVSARWELPSLIGPRFHLRRLVVDTVRVQILAAAPPDTTRARTLPQISLPLDLRVGELRVTDFRYRGVDPADTLRVDALRLAGAWAEGRAYLTRLEARAPIADLDARGFVEPRGPYPLDLTVGWTVRPPARPSFRGGGRLSGSVTRLHLDQRLEAPFTAHVQGGADSLLVHPSVDLATEFSALDPRLFVSEPVPMTLAGRLDLRGTLERFLAAGQVSVHSDSLGDLDLEGRVARDGDRVRMDSLLVRTARGPMRLVARGDLAELSIEPRANVALAWRNLVWPLRGDTTVCSAEGRATLVGTRAAYRFDLDAALATAQLDLGRLRARGSGDTAQARIDSLAAFAFDARVAGAGRVVWAPALRWQGEVRMDDLDPSHWARDWPGRLALHGHTRGETHGRTLTVEANLQEVHGTLRGLPLSGRGDFRMEGHAWSVDSLDAAWGRNRLTGRGQGGEHWNFDATLDAPQLAAVHDSLRGALRAHASLHGEGERASLALDCSGDSLGFAQDRVRHVDARVRASLVPNAPLELAVEAQDAVLGGVSLRTVHLNGDGTSAHHRIQGYATRAEDSLAIRLSGGLQARVWQGTLDRLDFASPLAGAWHLQAPVTLSVSQTHVDVGYLHLASSDAQLEAGGSWSANGPWNAHGTFSRVPLSFLTQALLWNGHAEGSFDGRFTAGVASAGPPTGSATIRLGPSRVISQFSRGVLDTLVVRGATLDAGLDHEGARLHATIAPGVSDSLSASFELPGFDPLHPDSLHQPVRGRLQGRLIGTKLLQMMAPGLTGARGTFTADLTVTGTLRQPALSGEARLLDAQASLPQLGLTFREVEARMQADGSPKLAITGSGKSGSGRLELEGSMEPLAPDPPKLELTLHGKDVTVADTRDASLRASLDLNLRLHGRDANLEGQVEIPEGRIQVANTLAKLPTPPSPDVVYTDRDTAAAAADVRLRSRVRLVLGDLVEVRAPGFRCKPKGNLLVVDEPGQATRGTGELKLHEGTYTAYGQDLTIEQGRLIFGGGVITNPNLDIRAVRKISSDIKAGFNITGTAEEPVLTVFSEPPMSQSEAMSYVMFGKTFESNSSESSMAKETASQLAVQGSDVLARNLAGKVGISDASVESKGGLQESSLFLGTYVSPQLYVSYGVGLFQPQRTFRVRYSLSKHWMLQAENSDVQTGTLQYTGEK